MYLNDEQMAMAFNTEGGLTLTWDVFKYYIKRRWNKSCKSLTLTWDVFKYKKLIIN